MADRHFRILDKCSSCRRLIMSSSLSGIDSIAGVSPEAPGPSLQSMTEATSFSMQLVYFPPPTCTGCFFVVANSPAKEHIIFKFGNRRSGLPLADLFVFIGTYEFGS